MKQGSKNKVYKLKKALYRLKKVPRAWYSHIDAYFVREGFRKCPHEQTLFTKLGNNGKLLVICLYVDYLIYCGNDNVMIDDFKKNMIEFEMFRFGFDALFPWD